MCWNRRIGNTTADFTGSRAYRNPYATIWQWEYTLKRRLWGHWDDFLGEIFRAFQCLRAS
jgi:hypothetical protein